MSNQFELWLNGRRQEQTFASRDEANVEAARRRGNDERMAVVVCVDGTGKLDDQKKLVVDRDRDRGRSATAPPMAKFDPPRK